MQKIWSPHALGMLELSSWAMDKIWHIGWWRLYSAGLNRLDDKKSKAWARLRLGSGSLSLARAKKIGLIPPLVQITQLEYSCAANNHFGLRDSFEFSRWLLNNWYSVRLGLANCTAVHLYIEAISNQSNKKFVGNFALVIGKVIDLILFTYLSFKFWLLRCLKILPNQISGVQKLFLSNPQSVCLGNT